MLLARTFYRSVVFRSSSQISYGSYFGIFPQVFRCISTGIDGRGTKLRIETDSKARSLVSKLLPEERLLLQEALEDANQRKDANGNRVLEPMTKQQLRQLFGVNFAPFIGFGILDNMIMIFAGEYIDQSLGAWLAISTMAAAALGNIVSDVAGVGLAHYVEFLVSKAGIKHPVLTSEQEGRLYGDQKTSEWHIIDESSARIVVENMSLEERERLRNAITSYVDESNTKYAEIIPAPQMKQLFYANAIPLIGFGFLDNALMIVAGEYLDQTMGAVLAISTMAAAGFGHIFADLAGMALSHYIEVLASKTGIKQPYLTSAQRESPSARKMVNSGRAVGLVIGCIIGMAPLLFYKNPKTKLTSNTENVPEQNSV